MIGEITRQVTSSRICYISTHLHEKRVSLSNTSKGIGILEFESNTDFIIRGFLAGPPLSSLIVFILSGFPNDSLAIKIRNIQSTDFTVYHQFLILVFGFVFFLKGYLQSFEIWAFLLFEEIHELSIWLIKSISLLQT